jgi:tetratricopeptide (TPR) repeat protein
LSDDGHALGKPDAAIPLLGKALQLNPRHDVFRKQLFLGLARIIMGQPDKAVTNLKKGLADFPKHPDLSWALVSALALSGHGAEAQDALSNYLQMNTASNRDTVERIRTRMSFFSPDIAKVLEGLRRAGMPER